MRGYKVFEPDWTCRGFRYAVGETFEEDVTPSCCNRGFHFCTELKNCFNYYSFNPNNKVAEIEALGEIDTESNENKHCTNKIKIVRELSWEEVLKMVNIGKANTGLCNSGYANSGKYNSGYHNSGNYNAGNNNSGSYNSGCNNSGNYNVGSHNSGSYNSGLSNSGNYNNGYCNCGDWNNTNFSSGCFNTEEAKILLFNKPSNWTFHDWWDSGARRVLIRMPRNTLEWVRANNITDEEKKQHPEYKTTGGYLKEFDNSKNSQIWWDNLPEQEKAIVKSIPNFDPDIFKKCTGIDVNKN